MSCSPAANFRERTSSRKCDAACGLEISNIDCGIGHFFEGEVVRVALEQLLDITIDRLKDGEVSRHPPLLFRYAVTEVGLLGLSLLICVVKNSQKRFVAASRSRDRWRTTRAAAPPAFMAAAAATSHSMKWSASEYKSTRHL